MSQLIDTVVDKMSQLKDAVLGNSNDDDDDDNTPPPPPVNSDSDSDSDSDSNDDEFVPPPPSQLDDDNSEGEGEDEDEDENEDDESIGTPQGTPSIIMQQPTIVDSDNDFDSDDDEDNDENYLQKFDETIQQQVITDYHPELKAHNYDEVSNLSKVVRNKQGMIIDPLHRSVPFITRYEKAKILGERAKQLSAGAKPFVEIEESVIDEYLIAMKEFNAKLIPFIVKRPMPNGGCEYWRMEDLEILV